MKFTIYIFTVVILFSSFTTKKDEKIIRNQIQQIQSIIDRDAIISYSKQYLGTPYIYAGNNPKKGFDCSGFVNYVFKYFDISLPRSSGAYKNIGKAKSPEDFKVGDILVFYGYKDRKNIGHLGIICEANGMKSKFIHASSGKIKSVTISALDSNHYSNRFYKCINVLSK
ncbi:C40 family peptidase [Flavobacterium sp. ALJ2]|uniref:C40 family peptidase n=1 Tax=Flavobacterium sp. ALJ2 TaxID=2786960 RepID=UPI00189F9BE1|nr:C40 family peptidase [Flavobacterium sp. ALJ2]MBF7090114.1 C40 family peptidase [Flavobacterium sp. ALJ2]